MSQILLVHEIAIDPLLKLKKLEKQDWSKTNLTAMLRYGIQYFKVGFF